MYCTTCGRAGNASDAYCTACGSPLPSRPANTPSTSNARVRTTRRVAHRRRRGVPRWVPLTAVVTVLLFAGVIAYALMGSSPSPSPSPRPQGGPAHGQQSTASRLPAGSAAFLRGQGHVLVIADEEAGALLVNHSQSGCARASKALSALGSPTGIRAVASQSPDPALADWSADEVRVLSSILVRCDQVGGPTAQELSSLATLHQAIATQLSTTANPK